MLHVSNQSLILVDFSYYVIYRYYALETWCKKANKKYTDEEFFNHYSKLFFEKIKKMTKKLKINEVLFIGDCSRNKIWRKNFLESYKSNRDNKQMFDRNIFQYVFDNIIPIIKKEMQFLCVDTVEADDIICILTKNIIKSYGSDMKIIIITNDNDYLQLKTDNVEIYDINLNDISLRGYGDPEKDLNYKILIGDSSDNIKGILTNKKVKELMKSNSDEIYDYICENNLVEKYNLNKQLIDMNCIPKDIEIKVLNEIQFV